MGEGETGKGTTHEGGKPVLFIVCLDCSSRPLEGAITWEPTQPGKQGL